MKSPIDLLESLLLDVRRLEPGVKGTERDVITLRFRFENEGFSFFAITLPSLCLALDRGLADGRFACPSGFKKIRSGALPVLFQGLLCKVFDLKTGSLKEDPELGVIKCLREVLMLFKKTQVSSDREELLDRKAVLEFIETDKKANSFILGGRHLDLLNRVSRLVLPHLNLMDEREMDFKHGPGGVVERVQANQKWNALMIEILRDPDRLARYGYDSFIGSFVLESETVDSWTSNEGRDRACSKLQHASSGTARLVTVPKNSTSRRTITVEPLLNQFIQQGFNSVLRDSIKKCTILSQCLALTDQSLNQKLALIGSQNDEWSTLDLKSASDLLSQKLVEIVFGRYPFFLEGIIQCRSPKVSTPHGEIDLGKFAGMGNATTFPVQSVVFAVVAMAAILDVDGRSPSVKTLRHAARKLRIYGDDIIVKTEYAHQVAVWLELVGLRINQRKSFFKGNFKESCGVDAFRGVDITPLYIKYRPDDTSVGPNALANWVSVSNHAWLRGLYSFATALQQHVESLMKKRLPLVKQLSGVLGWHTHLDASQAWRWNSLLHRLECKVPVLVPIKKLDKLNGYPALLKFFHRKVEDLHVSKSIIIDPKHLEQSPMRFQVKLAQRWVPS